MSSTAVPAPLDYHRLLVRLGILLGMLLALGCSRTRYRISADREVDCLVAQKSNGRRWNMAGFNIYPDVRSRFYDHMSIDQPPMPPDDPHAHLYMHRLNGMNHWPYWHKNGDRHDLESPSWVQQVPSYAPMTDDGAVKLDLDTAMLLGQIHSDDFRQQIETVYFSALDVSAERFRFGTQFYAGEGLLYNATGRNRTANGLSQSSLALGTNALTNLDGTSAQFQKQFTAGGELIVGFANSIVWQFAGPQQFSNVSLLNFNLVQPLLRQGGRAYALERLTIAERTLLANVRAFERYRQGYFTNVAIGDSSVSGPQRRGGFFGGTGLAGFSGQGSSGFGAVGAATNLGRSGFGAGGGAGAGSAGFAGGGAGNVGGYVGLLQSMQQIRNQQTSLDLQIRTLKLLEANLEAGLIDIVQVDQFRQNIQTERATLLQAIMTQENSFDTFKRQTLSLPPDMPMDLDDTLIKQFQFIDPKTTAFQNTVADFIESLGDIAVEAPRNDVLQVLDQFEHIRDQAEQRFAEVYQDLEAMRRVGPQREKLMSDADEQARFTKEISDLEAALETLEGRFTGGTAQLLALRAGLNDTNGPKTLEQLVAQASGLDGQATELSLIQARARLESVIIEKLDLTAEKALMIARANRLDWMNNRATLVDTWRLIQYNANALRSNLQVTLNGNLNTRGDNPVNFDGTTGVMQAGLRVDGPFTRLLERNNYRQALVDYLQDRRTLIRYEDSQNQLMRQKMRNLRQLEQNLEIQRRAVVISVRRVDKTREDLNEPPAPVLPGQATAQLGPTAALNLLTAISDLRNSQNNFMSVWLNYYAEQMQLYRDLGIMELDDRGMWIEVPWEQVLQRIDDPFPLAPEVPEQWLRDIGVDPRQVQEELETVPAPRKEEPNAQPRPLPSPLLKPAPGDEASAIEVEPRTLAERGTSARRKVLPDDAPAMRSKVWLRTVDEAEQAEPPGIISARFLDAPLLSR